MTEVFAGLDDLPWASMIHAYGPAEEVPELLRGLVDPDPAARERALHFFEMGIHHQGDVYDSTIAALPFLVRMATTPELPGRPEVIALIASIGGADWGDDDEDGEPEDGEGMFYATARLAVASEQDVWIDLLADPDPAVRAAAAGVLPAARGAEDASIAALLAMDEPDAGARIARIEAVGVLARRTDRPEAATVWLSDVLAGGDLPDRLAALRELTRLGVEVPVDLALDLIPRLYAEDTEDTEDTAPTGSDTGPPADAPRAARERPDDERRSSWAAEIVHHLAASLGNRVEDRRRLLTAMLRSAAWECRCDAILPAAALIESRRGDYREIVGIVGEQLARPHAVLVPRALTLLARVGPLAAPAAGALAARLEADDREVAGTALAGRCPALARWGDRVSVGDGVTVLARLGDDRVVPALEWLLAHPEMPPEVPRCVSDLGPAGARLIPALRHRLNRTAPGGRLGLARALRDVGAPVGEVVGILVGRPEQEYAAVALGEMGPAAAAALPDLRRWLRSGDDDVIRAAALAIARIGGPAGPVLRVVDRLADGDAYDRRDALLTLAALGPAGRSRADLARRFLHEPDSSWWTPMRAAEALCRVTGEVDEAVPVMRAAWLGNAHVRRSLARFWTEMPAAGARDLLDAEIGTARRHVANVQDDEELLTLCAAATGASQSMA